VVRDQPRQSLLAEGADMAGAIQRMEGRGCQRRRMANVVQPGSVSGSTRCSYVKLLVEGKLVDCPAGVGRR
jgi:hypothetical protein